MTSILIDEKSAELIGILLGDGSINIYKSEKYSTYYRLKVSFHSKETQHISHVSSLIKDVLGQTPSLNVRKNEKTAELLLFKKQIIQTLLDSGLINSPKWARARIPEEYVNKKLGKYVLRGYFDTDGSVVITNNNGTIYPRLEMKIMPSPMQSQFLELLKMYNFKFGAYQIGRGEIRVQLNGKQQLEKWKKEIGFSNEKHSKKSEKF